MPLLRRFLGMLFLAILLSACFGGGPAELLDTAQLEERQHNPTHALELYQELLEKHPHSKQAEVARERLKSLQNQKTTNQ